eukprot:scaffold5752_cov120-Cylindrotheca_fusiformis.AAC.3
MNSDQQQEDHGMVDTLGHAVVFRRSVTDSGFDVGSSGRKLCRKNVAQLQLEGAMVLAGGVSNNNKTTIMQRPSREYQQQYGLVLLLVRPPVKDE